MKIKNAKREMNSADRKVYDAKIMKGIASVGMRAMLSESSGSASAAPLPIVLPSATLGFVASGDSICAENVEVNDGRAAPARK